MTNVCDEFKGKKITLMGLGLLGRGIGDAAYLASCGAELIVTDLKSEADLRDSIAQLSQFKNITFRLGEHVLEDFENRDLILKAAGVPLHSPYIAHARENNIPIAMSAALFTKLSQIPVVGVTGTRGKSTVTHLIHHALLESTEGGKVLLGGNVRGVSNLQLLSEVEENSVAVLELDSWQLQGFGEEKISPQIAVFTTFMEDHLNYYKGNLEAYFEDKAQIFIHQGPGDTLVTTPQVFELIKSYAAKKGLTLRQEIILTDESSLPEGVALQIPGEHNRVNAALASEALRAMSLPEDLISVGLSSFKGVEGRLEHMGTYKGVEIYNDNNATTPDATIVGLRAVGKDKNVLLLMGGADKGIDTSKLLDEIKKSAKEVVLLPGSGSDLIKDSISNVHLVSTFKEGVEKAFELAENGDVLLFSPAFASFGLFKNEYERNDEFVELMSEKLGK